jgi:O-methyltransferase involved in polyketide biosynthesis
VSPSDSAHISPTAYYTGHVWRRNGLSHPALDTREGAALFALARPGVRVGRLFTHGVTLESMLLQRHLVIDRLLDDAISQGRIQQVLEIAGGMSGRGLRFSRKFGGRGLIYVEADLPAMAARKRAALSRSGLMASGHQVIAANALLDSGALSIAEATAGLFDATKGTALITEGLLSYFDLDTVGGMWSRFSRFLSGFPEDLYLTDIYLEGPTADLPAVRLFRRVLERFARRQTHLHFRDEGQLAPSLAQHGFSWSRVHRPRDWADRLPIPMPDAPVVVHVLEASTRRSFQDGGM